MANDNDNLMVWFEEMLVGKLRRESTGMIGFRYEESWLNVGFAISQQLPLTSKEYLPAAGKAHQFFVNLLPEADARVHIVRDLKISNSDFELLKAIGGECAGAFSILPTDIHPNHHPHYKQLRDEELKKILLRKGQVINLTSPEERPRLSLAGAQDKCPLFFDGKHYFLPQGAAPSTHILKFEITGFRNIPIYEYFTTKLALSVGLPVVDIQLNQDKDGNYLSITRYDRVKINQKEIKRLHQEDFCQALGVGYERKHEQAGGPSFSDCYHLIQEVSTNPIRDVENLLKWQIFNVLAGNSDGHAKNLALIYNENHQPELAPFYDLVCTRAIERIDTKLALAVGGEFNPDTLSLAHWKTLAEICDVREHYLRTMIKEMAHALLNNIDPTREAFEKLHGPCPALQRVKKVVDKQCNRTLRWIALASLRKP